MRSRTSLLPLVLLAGTALGGCQDTLARRDGISPGAGNAVAHNRAVHAIDPWSPASADARIEVSGARVARAVERYEAGGGPPGPGPGGMAPVLQLAPMAAPPVQ